MPRLVKIECNRSPLPNHFERKEIGLVFNQEISSAVTGAIAAAMSPSQGKVILQLKDVILPNQQSNCFSTGDLELSSSGTVTIITNQTVSSARIGSRLLLTVE
jgi:hypothetical protein